MMHRTICRHKPAAAQGLTLIVHDWGSIVGMLYQNKYPDFVSRIVALDVGILMFPKLKYAFHMIFYQASFAILYMFSQLISVTLFNILFKLYLIFVHCFKPYLSPTPFDTVQRPFSDLHVEMCYLYFYFYMHYLSGKIMMPNFPTCPLLFMVSILAFYLVGFH